MTQKFVNPYNGKEEETCSVSFAGQAHVASVHDKQTEAQFHKSRLLGEYGVLKAKHAKGQIPNGTKVLTFESKTFQGYVYVKSGKLVLIRYNKNTGSRDVTDWDDDVEDAYLTATSYKWSIPKAVQPKSEPQAGIVQTLTGVEPDQPIVSLLYWEGLDKASKTGKLPKGTVVAFNDEFQVQLVYKGKPGQEWEIQGADDNGDWSHIGYEKSAKGVLDLFDEGWVTPNENDATQPSDPASPGSAGEPLAAPTQKPAVGQNSTSTGSMSDEDVAALFVQTKDQLAKEQGINIKGANPALDALVHQSIGDQIGYTATEVKAKIDAYKATGKKLSALKKKVLKKGPQPTAKSKPADPDPSPMPNDVPTQATEDVLQDLLDSVPTAIDKSLYSNEDVAGAYVIAKDKVVAESGGKWTLYTKNDEMDSLIYKEIQDKTGHTMKEAKHAIAIYLSDPSNKLSKLKKSLIKQGKLKPEADTLKKKATPTQVLGDINKKADDGYTPAGHASNPDPPIPTGAFEVHAKPKADDLTFTGKTVGTHHAQIWVDKQGDQWLFKPQEQFLTEVDVATSKLAKAIGHPAADTYAFTLNGKDGALQRMFPGGDSFPNGFEPTKAPTAHVLAVQKEQVLDWLFANHDSHSANFVFDDKGNVVGIDKGQALKFFGRDELTWKTTVNQYQPAANKMWEEWAAGKNVALNDPTQGELKAFIDGVMSLNDKEFKEIFRTYAEAAKAKGALLTGSHWKHGVLKAQTVKTNDVEAFLEALTKRKNSLAKDFAKLHEEAKDERAKHVTPAKDAASVAEEPGDISHIPENIKEIFKNQVGTLFSSDSPATIHTKLTHAIHLFTNSAFDGTDNEKLGKLSVLQAVRIMDELKAKKANVTNGHLYEKKLVGWLASPEGKSHFQSLKDKEEALKKVEQMKASQPDLPPDSALFKDIELEEVRKWQSEQTPWTASQEAALKHYTSNQGFTEMNGNLRNTSYKADRVDKLNRDAREGMRPLDRPIVTHRGTTAISFGLAESGENELLYGLVGTLHKQIGFSSASYGSKAGFGSRPVIIHFECPPGTPAAFVRDISYFKHSSENEILLDHHIEVRVLRVHEEDGGWMGKQFHVHVRIENWEGKDDS